MTSLYDSLQAEPQVDIDRALLAPMERAELRVLSVNRSSTNESPEYPGSFISVYYLEGDERRAAKRFVEENRKQLEAIDFSNHDIVTRSLDRTSLDWVLHFLGERELRKYQTVIYERRRDGTEWVIERDHFEERPNRRYTASSRKTVSVDESLSIEQLYDDLEAVIRPRDLQKHDAVHGSVRWLLEYFRVAGVFNCVPITVDGTPAIEKRSG